MDHPVDELITRAYNGSNRGLPHQRGNYMKDYHAAFHIS